jgi:phosphoenolpyruvate carboxykinase (GTP)
VKRCQGRVAGYETPIGWTPDWKGFNTVGLEGFTRERFDAIMLYRQEDWLAELTSQTDLFLKLYHTMPKELMCQRELLMARLV